MPDETTTTLLQKHVDSRYQLFWIVSYGFITPNIEPLSIARDALITKKYANIFREEKRNYGKFAYNVKSNRQKFLFNDIEITKKASDVGDICNNYLPVDFYVVTADDSKADEPIETLLNTCKFVIDDGVFVQPSVILLIEGNSLEYDAEKARQSFLLKNLSMKQTTTRTRGLCICKEIADCLNNVDKEINMNISIAAASVILLCIAMIGLFKGLLNIRNHMTSNNRVNPLG